jgi:hypothetical protein
MKMENDSIVISSSDEKNFELTIRYGESIFGLTPDNRIEVSNVYLRPFITEMLNK